MEDQILPILRGPKSGQRVARLNRPMIQRAYVERAHAASSDAVEVPSAGRAARKSFDVYPRQRVLSGLVTVVTLEQVLARIDSWVAQGESRYICFCNVHSIVSTTQDDEFRRVVNEADMALADGKPIAWTLRLRHLPQSRIAGPDLMLAYLARAAARSEPVFFLGSTQETLARLHASLSATFPTLNIAGMYSPPFRELSEEEDVEIASRINNSGARVLFVGLGCPKQEKWMAAHRGRVRAVMLGVGAAFDYHAGTLKRAPAWMQDLGLEWLHRLCSDPARLWKRYLVTNLVFMLATLRQSLRGQGTNGRDIASGAQPLRPRNRAQLRAAGAAVMTPRPRVTVLQHRLLHYRVGLFERLRAECDRRGIDLRLVHGQPSPRETHKKDTGTVPWADQVSNRWMSLLEHDLLWQPLPAALRDSDLVVIMQENRILSNYPLVLRRLLSAKKVAYWGHGANLQSLAPSGLRERWKRLMANRVDWWFAYTQRTEEILRGGGYPSERITCLNNAIDQDAFRADLADVSTGRLQALRSEIGAPGRAPIGVHCGSLYWIKRLDLLVEAADRIHAAIPPFRLVIVGDGPGAAQIRRAAETRPWLKWVGARKGVEKAAWFRLADVVLNPGAVGLHVLDSFCAGVPMVTTRDARHGPEIAYLRNGINGLIVPGTAQAYADAVISLLQERHRLDALKQAALQEARRYTLDNMVSQFVEGISRCLATPKKSPHLRPMAH